MTLTLTNSTLSTTFDSTEIDANFADIVAKFNGNILNSDINASAAVAVTKLAAYREHIVLERTWQGGAAPFAAGWPAANTVIGYLTLPGFDNGSSWVVTDIEWACSDTGAGAATFNVNFGDMSTGAFSGAAVTSSAITITNAAGIDDANGGQGAITGGAYTCTFDATYTKMFEFKTASAADATTLNAAGDWLSVAILLRRTITST
jgi:hypothetical protein